MLLLFPVHHIAFHAKQSPKTSYYGCGHRQVIFGLLLNCLHSEGLYPPLIFALHPHQALTHSSKFRHSSWLIQHTVPPNTAEIIVFPLRKRRVPILSYDHSVSSGICCSSITLLPCSAPTPGDSSLVT